MCMLSCVQLFAMPWTVARQTPLSMEFSTQEYLSGLPFPSSGNLPNPGIQPVFLACPALAGRFFTTVPPGVPHISTSGIIAPYGLPWWLRQKRICLQHGRPGFNPRVRKIPWRRAWQHTPIFLPGESPWTEEPGRLQSLGSQRVGHD